MTGEREASLNDTLGTASQYYDVLQELSDWLPGVNERLEAMPPISAQPDVIQQQKLDTEVSNTLHKCT